jgi:hypothetical protein
MAIIASFLLFLPCQNYLALKWKFNLFYGKNDAVRFTHYDAGIALLLMNSLTKSFTLVAANIAEAEVEFILPVINWACLWFCIEQHIH